LDFFTLEKELNKDAFGLYRDCYALAHTAAFTRKFPGFQITLHIDDMKFSSFLDTISKEKDRIMICAQRIDTAWMSEQIGNNPVILYGNAHSLYGEIHAPHFIYVFDKADGGYRITDPWNGKARTLAEDRMNDFVGKLKYLLGWSPIAITMNEV